MSQKTVRKKQQQRRRSNRLLPILIGLGGFLLISVALFATLKSGSSAKAEIEVTGAPRLKVDRKVIDMGEIKLGKTVKAEFTLTNVGDQKLQFTDFPYVEVVEGC